MDFPYALLRGLGAVLMIVGFVGAITGIYAISVVGNYAGMVRPSLNSMEDSLSTSSINLEKRKLEFQSSIADAGTDLLDASKKLDSASTRVESASKSIASSADNLEKSSGEMKEAAALNQQAGTQLKAAAAGLKKWSDEYKIDSTSLPSKALFQLAVVNMSNAAVKLEASGGKMSSAATGIESTASDLEDTSRSLSSTSKDLDKVGEELRGTGSSIDSMKKPFGNLVTAIVDPIKDTKSGVRMASQNFPLARSGIYIALGYFTILHLIMFGLGIALVVIEMNLVYPR